MLPSSRPSCSLDYLGWQDSTNRSLSTVIVLSAQVSLAFHLESTVYPAFLALGHLSSAFSDPVLVPVPVLVSIPSPVSISTPDLVCSFPSVGQDYPPRNNAVIQTPGLTNRALGCPQAPLSILRDDDVCGMKAPAVKTSLCMYGCVFLPLRDRDSTIFNILGCQPGT